MTARVRRLTHKQFVAMVLELAKHTGWRSFCVRPARTLKGWRTPLQGNGRGWPDIFLARESTGEAIAFELKIPPDKPTPEQLAWLACLRACGIPATVATPDDWTLIEAALRR